MVVYDNLPIKWPELLSALIPLVIAKHQIQVKKLSVKKIFEKLKDIRLEQIGLEESAVQGYFDEYINPNSRNSLEDSQPAKPTFSIPSFLHVRDSDTSRRGFLTTRESRSRSNSHDHSYRNLTVAISHPDILTNNSPSPPSSPTTPSSPGSNRMSKRFSLQLHNSQSDSIMPFSMSKKEDSNNNLLQQYEIMKDQEPATRKFKLKMEQYKEKKEEQENKDIINNNNNNNIIPIDTQNNMNNDQHLDEIDSILITDYNNKKNNEEDKEDENNNNNNNNSNNSNNNNNYGDITMKDIMQDTPMFRNKLKIMENDILQFGSQLKKFVNISNDCCNSGEYFSKETVKFAEYLTNFNFQKTKVSENNNNGNNTGNNKEIIEEWTSEMSNTLIQMEQLRLVWITELQETLIKPMEEIVEDEIKDLRKQSKKFDKNTNNYEKVETKISNRKDSKKSHIELLMQRSKMQTCGLNLIYKLISLNNKREIHFVDSLANLMLFTLDYYSKSYNKLKQNEGTILKMKSIVAMRKAAYEKAQVEMALQRDTFVKELLFQPSSLVNVKETEGFIKQSYLFKRSGIVHPIWKKRFFVLESGMLFEKKDLETVNAHSLITSTVKRRPDLDKRVFEFVTPQKSYLLQAETENDCIEWCDLLQQCVTKQLIQQQQPGNTPESNYLTLQPGNQVCADCGAPNPDWCSINIGSLICLECSGIHRSLGVYISKVRSLTLDFIDNELMSLLLLLGNSIVNQIYEYQLTYSKPNSTSDRATKEKFIRDKYEHKLFINSEEIHNSNKAIYKAAKLNDCVGILELITRPGTNIDYQSANKHQTPLIISSIKGHSTAALLLLLNKANPLITDCRQRCLLHYGTEYNLNSIINVVFRYCEKEMVTTLFNLKDSENKSSKEILCNTNPTLYHELFPENETCD